MQLHIHRGKITLIACGSIGLGTLLRKHAIRSLDGLLQPVPLAPWGDHTARGFILQTCSNLTFAEDVLPFLLETLGYNNPYHIRLFCKHLCEDDSVIISGQVNASDISRIYEKKLLPEAGDPKSRLDEMLDKAEFDFVCEALIEAAFQDVLSNEALEKLIQRYDQKVDNASVQFLLEMLEREHYLRKVASGYVFAAKLKQDLWRRTQKTAYTPILKRASS